MSLIITSVLRTPHRRSLNAALRAKWEAISNEEAQGIGYYVGVRWQTVKLWFAKDAKGGGPLRVSDEGSCYIGVGGAPGTDPDQTIYYVYDPDTGATVPVSETHARMNVAAVLGEGLERKALYSGTRHATYRLVNTLAEGLTLADSYYCGSEDAGAIGFMSQAFTKMYVERDPYYEVGGPPYRLVIFYNEYERGDSKKLDGACEEEESE